MAAERIRARAGQRRCMGTPPPEKPRTEAGRRRNVKAAPRLPCYRAQMGLILLRFALAIWFGGGLAVLFGTRAIFRVVETRKQGGIFSGAVLASFFGLRWAAVALTAVAWFFLRAGPTYGATPAAAFTLAQAPLDASIRRFRDQIGGSTEGLGLLLP